MGSNCNLNCEYCHRQKSDNEPIVTQDFLYHIQNTDYTNINFFGGEPTLYMDQIKKIVDVKPNATFRITTNGILLDKYIDYFRENEFLVCISYDGQNKGKRGYDPFTKVLNYPWLAVSCLIYHGNTDFKKILNNFSKKESIIGRSITFYPHIIHYTSELNKHLRLTKDDFDILIPQYKEFIETYVHDYIVDGFINRNCSGIFNRILKRYYANNRYGDTNCANRYFTKCDASGKVFSCLYIRDESVEESIERITREYPLCKKCSVYDMCAAGCIKSLDHHLECYFYKTLYSWFKEFIKPYGDMFKKDHDKYFYISKRSKKNSSK